MRIITRLPPPSLSGRVLECSRTIPDFKSPASCYSSGKYTRQLAWHIIVLRNYVAPFSTFSSCFTAIIRI